MSPSVKVLLSIPLFFGSMCIGSNLYAQQKFHKNDDSNQHTSHWDVGLSYLSDNVYQGRKDSAAAPYITPSIGYHDKSGFFLTGSMSYLPVSGESRIDLITFEGGYSYSSDHLNLELSAAKDFYSDQSYAVSSEISGRLSGYFSYDFGFIEPSLDLGATIGTSHDLGVGLGLEHSFSMLAEKLQISPKLVLNAGTQNFYANYYNKRKYSSKNQGSSTTFTAIVQDASKFQLMDYEISSEIEYKVTKKFKFNFVPTLALPVNPSDITIQTKTNGGTNSKTSQENLTNAFFFSIGCVYSF
ncbi:MAG: hypothetical protein C5B59_19930 [Bacteroidetes bacterium]|nr:MAG: hypothetical protein C5B59_19930 [Bacteroidota bacterium]